jgi:crossover junction endodeoxyribonuclease RuvC
MLQQLLGLKELPKISDSTDGLAAAVCHFNLVKWLGLKLHWLGCFCKTKRRERKKKVCSVGLNY